MHKAQALAIHCVDFRFQEMTDADLTKRGLQGKFDRISWPGASKDLENIKNACEVSLSLHDPDEIIIYEHEDCGAYGENNSETAHKSNAQKLMAALKEIKPSLKFSTFIATFDGIKDL